MTESAAAVDASASMELSGPGWHVSLGRQLGRVARWASEEAEHVRGAARRAAVTTRQKFFGADEALAPLVEELAKLIEAQKASGYDSLENDAEFWTLVKKLNQRGGVLGGRTPGPVKAEAKAKPAKGATKGKAKAKGKQKAESEKPPEKSVEEEEEASEAPEEDENKPE